MNSLYVFEIYPSIQGESTHAGRKCVFIRLAGCNLACSYCDSTEAATGQGVEMTLDAVMGKVGGYDIGLVEVTGGEPLIQPGAGALLERLCDAGFETLVETNGTVDITRFDRRAKFIMDIKTPGSGAEGRFLERNLEALATHDEVKFVITGRGDFEWAANQVARWNLSKEVVALFSPVHGKVAPKELAQWLLESGIEGRLNLQLHKIIWGADATGV
ncbi:MAG: radical SAM protein [Nitrospinota bacterium]|nr:radical SAM protein [Nitrospinota bacterium]MDH5677117.1 radical SAM protein [Nitrospinota bacterium]MDH5755881.1 radical SAM protein [Nitrospinota bacterium]